MGGFHDFWQCSRPSQKLQSVPQKACERATQVPHVRFKAYHASRPDVHSRAKILLVVHVPHGYRSIHFDRYLRCSCIPLSARPIPVFWSRNQPSSNGIGMDVVDHMMQRLDLIRISVVTTTRLPKPVTFPLAIEHCDLRQPFRSVLSKVSDRFSSDFFFDSPNDRSNFQVSVSGKNQQMNMIGTHRPSGARPHHARQSAC